MSYHHDPTASQAIGNVDREWRQLALLAWRLRTAQEGAGEAEKYRRTFTGIYRRLMTCPLEELAAQLPRGRRG